jgi:hypothetical protein
MVKEFITALTTSLIDLVNSGKKRAAINNIKALNTQTNNTHYPNGRTITK